MILESSRGGLSSQMRITPRIDIERGDLPCSEQGEQKKK